MNLNTFPSPKKNPLYSFKNKFGVEDRNMESVVKQSQVQIDDSITELRNELINGVALTDAANILTDASLGINFYVTIGGNRNMSAPTNPSDWKIIRYYITQDNTGSRTITWDSAFRFSVGIPSPTLTTTADYSDYIEFIYNPTYSTWDCIRIVNGFESIPL